MNEVTQYHHEVFGPVRALSIEGKPHFAAKDVATALGYQDSDQAIRKHCRHAQTCPVVSTGQVRKLSFIPEGDVIRLVMRSRLPAAERFEAWVCDEVIPTILRTGAYVMPPPADLAPFCPVIDLGEKMRALRLSALADVTLYREIAKLRKELAGPVPETTEKHSPEGAIVDWVRSLAAVQQAAGDDERTYSMPDLVAKAPPLPNEVRNPDVALGQRLRQLAGTPITLPTGGRAVLAPMRTRHSRMWILRVGQEM